MKITRRSALAALAGLLAASWMGSKLKAAEQKPPCECGLCSINPKSLTITLVRDGKLISDTKYRPDPVTGHWIEV